MKHTMFCPIIAVGFVVAIVCSRSNAEEPPPTTGGLALYSRTGSDGRGALNPMREVVYKAVDNTQLKLWIMPPRSSFQRKPAAIFC